MKERGKAVEMCSKDLFGQDHCTSSDLPCSKHPSSSPVGICAYCLKDRLVNLVCSDCGEQRLSSCSCSGISSNRNSCTVEVGSVGRVSFLIENENQKNDLVLHSDNSTAKPKSSSGDQKGDGLNFSLKRSSSSCVEIKRKNGFWGIGRLFSRKRGKGCDRIGVAGFEEKSDLWVVDYMGVSRCRSLCSFRGGGFFGSEDGTFSGARSSISAARSSISAARNSGVNGGLLFDPDRKSGFGESEPRKSGFDGEKRDTTSTALEPERPDSGHDGAHTRRVFSVKEGNFTTVDDSGFIDLKFDFPSESKADLSAVKMVSLSDSNSAFGSMGGGDFDRGIKRSRKSFKSWRWIFRQHPSSKKQD
ncbi:hypothetical protein DKX38_012795 [Salix brachista]|uniref:Uncharacterized protein n=1 Tax=Salix brachista TaxID=2182728 RepID=A0A5N5LPN6_9ROSI|nr:hypothetical protein DKX38_012795 [Salix brachista]